MKYYIDGNNNLHGLETDGSQDHLITVDMTPIELEEIQAINQAKEDEFKQSLEYKINEANQYLKDTDWISAYKLRHDLGLEVIQESSSKWEVINKREEYILFLKGVNNG